MDTRSDLADFTLGDMVRLAASVRTLTVGAAHVEQYAGRLCTHLHETFIAAEGDRQALLVRLYLTQPWESLPDTERDFALQGAAAPAEGFRCLTLLGTAGDEPAWNDRHQSKSHLVLPLQDERRVNEMPMVASLFRQMGIDVAALVEPGGRLRDQDHRYGVFHVPEAVDSPLIPAQDFVHEYGVRSVLGFGGVLPDGEMYAVVLFTRVAVPRTIAHLLETLSPSITLALVELLDLPVFAERIEAPQRRSSPEERASAREALLRGLLEVHERVAALESDAARAAVAAATREAEKSATLARTLQASLLPHDLPKVSGMRTAGFFRPAGDGSEVGGDFYDLFAVRRGTWGLVLGDVSGKGVGAASLTALARHTVRAAAMRAKSCVEVLRVLNDAVYRQEIAEERYLTAVFAFLRRQGDVIEVDMCLGGHEAPLLLRPGQPAVDVGTIGQPLGLFRAAELTRSQVELRRGDSLITYTDGVTEARRDGDLFGQTRAHATLSALADRHVEDIVRGLADAVLGFQSQSASDDIAVLGIQSTR